MKKYYPPISTTEQTVKINELLGANEAYFNLNDVINHLPADITYRGVRGYLSLSHVGIEYTSLDYDYKVNVVQTFNFMPNRNVYDAFIDALEFFEKQGDKITINS